MLSQLTGAINASPSAVMVDFERLDAVSVTAFQPGPSRLPQDAAMGP
jgi:hypothetical protein